MLRIERRDFWLSVLLFFLTCGLYRFYFVYKTTAEFNQMAGDDGETIDPAMTILWTIVTCGIYVFWWYYKMGNRIQALATRNQVYVSEDGTTYLVWMVVGTFICGGPLIAMYFYLNNFNKLVDAYNAHLGGPYTPPPSNAGSGPNSFGGTPFAAQTPTAAGTSAPSSSPMQQPPAPSSWNVPASSPVIPVPPAAATTTGSDAAAAPQTPLAHDPYKPISTSGAATSKAVSPSHPTSPPPMPSDAQSVKESFDQILATIDSQVATTQIPTDALPTADQDKVQDTTAPSDLPPKQDAAN